MREIWEICDLLTMAAGTRRRPPNSGTRLVRRSRSRRSLLCRRVLWHLLGEAVLRGRVGQNHLWRPLSSSPCCGLWFDRRRHRTLCCRCHSAMGGHCRRRHRCCRCRWLSYHLAGICLNCLAPVQPDYWNSMTSCVRPPPPHAGRSHPPPSRSGWGPFWRICGHWDELNLFQGINYASLCSLAGQYDNPIPTRFLAPIDCLKIPAQSSLWQEVDSGESVTQSPSPPAINKQQFNEDGRKLSHSYGLLLFCNHCVPSLHRFKQNFVSVKFF